MRNYAIMREKGVAGTNGWRSYQSEDTQAQMRKDINGNGYTVVAIFTEKEIAKLKKVEFLSEINYKYSYDIIDFVKQIF